MIHRSLPPAWPSPGTLLPSKLNPTRSPTLSLTVGQSRTLQHRALSRREPAPGPSGSCRASRPSAVCGRPYRESQRGQEEGQRALPVAPYRRSQYTPARPHPPPQRLRSLGAGRWPFSAWQGPRWERGLEGQRALRAPIRAKRARRHDAAAHDPKRSAAWLRGCLLACFFFTPATPSRPLPPATSRS